MAASLNTGTAIGAVGADALDVHPAIVALKITSTALFVMFHLLVARRAPAPGIPAMPN
jgi:hypothetical protein